MLTHRLFADLVEVCWLPSAGERDQGQRNSGGDKACDSAALNSLGMSVLLPAQLCPRSSAKRRQRRHEEYETKSTP